MFSHTSNGKKHLCENMNFVTHEAIKRMRTNTIFALPQNDECKIIGITSAQPGEGKTTSSINLAYSFSELNIKVLLIDADLHHPSVGEKLDISSSVGFGNLLSDATDISSAVVQYKSKSDGIAFDVIRGNIERNTSELLSSPQFVSLLSLLKKEYNIIIIDLPPIGAVIDAVIVGKHTDGMIVIARENETPKKQFNNCIKQIELPGIKILGLAFNGSIEGADKKYKYRYRY